MSLWTSIKGVAGVRGRGCLPDRPDARDATFRVLSPRLGVSVPALTSDWEEHVAVQDQGATNSCVGQSLAQAAFVQMAVDGWGDRRFFPSAHAIYSWARAYTGMQTQDIGTHIRDGARAMKQFGFPPESAWPSKPRTVNVVPNITAYKAAADQRKLAGYYRIPRGDTLAIRLALTAGKPVVFGLQLRESFLDGNEKVIDVDRGRELGGHAMTICGHWGDDFRAVSSWGTTWRDNGKCWISERRIREEAMDLWCCDLL